VRRPGRLVGVTALLACVVLVLVAAPGALAASPNQIYRDYADNGRLDSRYSRADLERALRDVQIQGYGGPTVKSGVLAAIQGALAPQTSGLPFTGFDLALMALGGASLLTVGAGFRRLGKAKQAA
jgi:hypothetical protein